MRSRSPRSCAAGERRRRRSAVVAAPLALLALLAALLSGCAPSAAPTSAGGDELQPFKVPPLPVDRRYVVAVPDFQVRSGSVHVDKVDLSGEGEGFYKELGSGVADIFVTEAFRSGRFRITERAQLDQVLREQNLAASGRVDPTSAAELGRITGAELIALGSLTEFSVSTTGGGGKVLGVIGGSAETVTARVTVDIRLVDAVTAEVKAIGVATSEVSQSNVRVDVLNIVKALQAGRSGTTIIDIAVRNAIRGAIDEAARSIGAKRGP